MGSLFNKGETKIRPGVYRRRTKTGDTTAAGAMDGVGAVAIQADWGPLGVVTTHETASALKSTYGESESVLKTACRLFDGGAKTVHAVRLGTGGKKATIPIKSAETTALFTLTQKYEGTKVFSVTIREKLGDAATKEFIVYDKSKEVERITFAVGAEEAKNLAAAINDSSKYFVAGNVTGTGMIGDITNTPATGGENPTVTNNDYSTGFDLLEAFKFNTICVDTNAVAVHALLSAFIDRVYETGNLMIGVVGEPTTVDFNDRCDHAAAFNDEKMAYVGGAYKDTNGNIVEGFEAAALIAGFVASTPSNQGIVHKIITGAVDTAEKLTNTQYINAIKSGMIVFSNSQDGQVWVDSGVNTLITLDEDMDEGWKKIKRTKVRFELMDRIDMSVARLIGKINGNADGVANVIKISQDVIDAMAAEEKILPGGTIYEDPEHPHKGDSAWFIIAVDDIDTLEKVYLTYQFRFSANK